MTFEARMTAMPRPFDARIGAEAVDAAAVSGALAELVAGVAGCSPYLRGLMGKEADWLPQVWADPDAALAAELARVAELPLADLGPELRRAKRRVALVAALADVGGVWDLARVTRALSEFADAACDVCIRRLVAVEVARGKLGGFMREGMDAHGGMAVLAMGKGGACELNYSSDIDLIVLFDDSGYAPETVGDARAILIRITRKMVSLLNDVTADGYVFRTDLRLRPDPSVTPVCLSMSAAEAYYESVGRTWERAAYIKARAAAGDVEAGEAFLRTMRPFVWRKHLDFAAIQDAHDMRLLIREHKGLGGPLTLPGHNMKLGRGGIREIEFFTQTRQLIAGGRDEGLRHRGTVAGLNALQEAGWVEPDIAEGLQERYVRHRDVEHRLQMVNDQQTHSLPTSDEGFERLAAFMGTGVADLKSRLQSDLEQVHRWTDGFFAPDEAQEEAPVIDDAVVARWPDYPALRSERAAGIFQRLRPEILARLQEAAKPEEALANFDRFLAALPAGVQLFSLFEANPQLTQLMVDICATAPALAEYLSRNAGVFDAVIGGEFFADWPGGAALEQALAAALAAETDYEARLDAARRWQKEWHFRVGVHHLRGLIDAETAGRQYADLARATLRVLWPEVTAQFTTKHGPPPGRGAVVVGMGSLGAARLHAASDLDLIVVYDGAGVDASDGPRSLSTRPYYARLTQALITALTAPMAQGRLYEVDMRLRPSGRQGPVATALTSFQSYQLDEAWTWEHLALTRAEVIAGPDDLRRDVEDIRARVLQAKSGGATVLADVADMRARLADAKPGAGGLDVKSGTGRLQDVELAAQTIALQAACFERQTEAQIAKGVAVGLVDAADGAALTDAARLWWQVQCTVRLIVGDGDPAAVTGEGGLRFLLRETGVADMAALQKDISTVAAQVAAIISKRLETTDEG